MKIYIIIRNDHGESIVEDNKGYSSYEEAEEVLNQKTVKIVDDDPEHLSLDDEMTIWQDDIPYISFQIEPVEFTGCQVKFGV